MYHLFFSIGKYSAFVAPNYILRFHTFAAAYFMSPLEEDNINEDRNNEIALQKLWTTMNAQNERS